MSEQQQRGWWSRNWKWFVPVGCLGLLVMAVAGVALLVALVFGIIKSSDVYKESLTQTQASAPVREILGSPIEPGFLVSGSINISGPSGNADLAIPISGPNGSGTIYAVATRSAGRWTFTTLDVEIEGREPRISLMPTEELQEATEK